MVDFNRINLSGIQSTGPVGSPKQAAPAANPSLLAGGAVDTVSFSGLGGGASHNVDFNAISNMSLADAKAALPGSFNGLQFLASV